MIDPKNFGTKVFVFLSLVVFLVSVIGVTSKLANNIGGTTGVFTYVFISVLAMHRFS